MKLFSYSILLTFLLLACAGEQKKEEAQHDHAAAVKYMCPMHPEVVRDAPGQCPICGMDLQPANEIASHSIMLNESQVTLANISTQSVQRSTIGQTLVINGTLAANENTVETISSRAAGRIEKLFYKETGRTIKQGEPLYELYSEILLTLQQEYLLAKEQYETVGNHEPRYQSFLKAAEGKLLRYGLTQEQVTRLGATKTVQQRVTFLSPASGIITATNVTEGQYVQEGSTLYTIGNIRELWAEADLYPQETSAVKTGDTVHIRINGFESDPVEGKVVFLTPAYRANTQITTMRAVIKNQDGKFKPGMQAQVLLSHSSRQAIAVPSDAVIRSAKGTHVYLETHHNTFQPRAVKTGLEDFDRTEITEGLEAGDTVVVTGAYLLYSEMILKKGIHP